MNYLFYRLSRLRHTLPIFLSILFSTSVLYAEPANISLLKKEIIQYHDSGLYEKELIAAINPAKEYLLQQVEMNKQNKHPQQLAIVFDIDETSLSNYNYLLERDFGGNKELIHKAIMSADAPAIEPTLELYKLALNGGVKVFFITGRQESERIATQKNLIKAGYTQWDGLYFRPNDYHLESIQPFKTQIRSELEKQGYTVIITVGDQYSDIRGGFAQRGFKLPNPFYYLL